MTRWILWLRKERTDTFIRHGFLPRRATGSAIMILKEHPWLSSDLRGHGWLWATAIPLTSIPTPYAGLTNSLVIRDRSGSFGIYEHVRTEKLSPFGIIADMDSSTTGSISTTTRRMHWVWIRSS